MFRHFEGFDCLDHFERPPRRVVTDKTNPFEAMTEREFLLRYRLNKESTNFLIQQIQQNLPNAQNGRGNPVPPHLQVLIALRYLATGNHQLTISDCADVSQSYVSTCVARVVRAIAGLCEEWVKMLSGNEVNTVMQAFYVIAGMPAVLGCIDCTHIAINRPPGDRSETFRNRKGCFSLNVQSVCGPHLQLFSIVARWYGSAHDSYIFDNSRLCQELEDGFHRGHLLGDSGYPCRRYLLTPILNAGTLQEGRYNTSQIKTRNTIERAFGVLKRRFGCLGKRMQTEVNTTKAMIVAASVLHNIAIQQNASLPENVPEDAYLAAIRENPDDPDPVFEVDGNLQRNVVGIAERQHIIRNYF